MTDIFIFNSQALKSIKIVYFHFKASWHLHPIETNATTPRTLQSSQPQNPTAQTIKADDEAKRSLHTPYLPSPCDRRNGLARHRLYATVQTVSRLDKAKLQPYTSIDHSSLHLLVATSADQTPNRSYDNDPSVPDSFTTIKTKTRTYPTHKPTVDPWPLTQCTASPLMKQSFTQSSNMGSRSPPPLCSSSQGSLAPCQPDIRAMFCLRIRSTTDAPDFLHPNLHFQSAPNSYLLNAFSTYCRSTLRDRIQHHLP